MSSEVVYILAPRRISGARYHSVTTSCVYVRIGILNARANPKSANFMWPVTLHEQYNLYVKNQAWHLAFSHWGSKTSP